MEFSGEQQRALASIERWFRERSRPWFYLSGPPGVGKSSIALEAARRCGGQVKFGAFTGMAARVMRSKGCEGATTLHQLMYLPMSKCGQKLEQLLATLKEEKEKEDPNPVTVADLEGQITKEREHLRSPSFSLRENHELRESDLVIVDEVSMVSDKMMADLLSFEVPVLVLGDPGQLPPVRGVSFFAGKSPDCLLTEIHRQAEASPIIRMLAAIRAGEQLVPRDWGDGCRVVERGTLTLPELAAFDQIIVGTNAKRVALNSRLRSEHLGRTGPLPVPGDRVVCRKNNHQLGLLNGTQGVVHDAEIIDDDFMWLGVTEDGNGTFHEVISWRHLFEGREHELPPFAWQSGEQFDHAYVITGHRAQGSQWDKVCVLDQSRVFRHEATNWLNTCVSRAAKEVTVIV